MFKLMESEVSVWGHLALLPLERQGSREGMGGGGGYSTSGGQKVTRELGRGAVHLQVPKVNSSKYCSEV